MTETITGKLALKKSISDLFYNLISRPGLCGDKNTFRALVYHSITDKFAADDFAQMTTPKELFEKQISFLRDNGYEVFSCSQMVDTLYRKTPIPGKVVCITFDDGFKDNLLYAKPILEAYGYKATIFLAVDFVEKGGPYLGWDDIKDLSAGGVFEFGSHTCSHRKLSELTKQKLEYEITRSKEILESKLGRRVDLFAYPFGSYDSFDKDTMEIVKRAGYRAAFTNVIGSVNMASDPFRLNRTRISWTDDIYEFRKEIIGSYDWYKIWQRLSRTNG